MNSAMSPADQRMMVGIFSVDQAATMLDCEPIATKRLIALGRLPDSRNSKGSVVMKSDIERFIGQGSPDIEMPPIDKSWFTSFRGEVSRVQFSSAIRASAKSLSMPTDQQLAKAFAANRRATSLSFTAKPTAEMKAAFAKPTSASLLKSGETTLTFGVVALITTLRCAASREARKQANSFASPLGTLYDSPAQFRSITETSLKHALGELAITFTESRQIEGRSNPLRVTTSVSFADLSSTPQRDIERAKQLAF